MSPWRIVGRWRGSPVRSSDLIRVNLGHRGEVVDMTDSWKSISAVLLRWSGQGLRARVCPQVPYHGYCADLIALTCLGVRRHLAAVDWPWCPRRGHLIRPLHHLVLATTPPTLWLSAISARAAGWTHGPVRPARMPSARGATNLVRAARSTLSALAGHRVRGSGILAAPPGEACILRRMCAAHCARHTSASSGSDENRAEL